MKAKLLFITMFLLLQMNCLFAQCISVELSITWQMGYDIFKKDSVISIPMLTINYRNNSDANYYFFKVSPTKGEARVVQCWPPYYEDADYYRIAKSNLHIYTNQNFNVIMGREPHYGAGWMVCSDTIDYSKIGFSFEYVGCSLQEIYHYMHPDYYKNYEGKIPAYFLLSDMTSENILDSMIKDQFVFLKPNETHIDTYNLIGFKLVEGCFTFMTYKNTIENYVLTYDHITKLELPAIVGEYQLYSGGFNTNKVTVCFGYR